MKLKVIILTFLFLLFVGTALATDYGFVSIHANINIPTDYTVLQPNNLELNEEFLSEKDLQLDDVIADFSDRGVLLQAWKGDILIEVSAVQNQNSTEIMDVDQQSEEVRGLWRTSYFPRNEYLDTGYEYKSSNWKNFGKNVGRFLVQEYVHTKDGKRDYAGYIRRTIRNGYEIVVEVRALGRNASNADNIALNKVFKTFSFSKTEQLSATPITRVNISKAPSAETKDRRVEIAGDALPGVEFTAAVMSLGAEEPIILKAMTGKNGKFKIPITFNKQGVFLVTLSALNDGEEIGEWAFPVTYREGLLAVSIDEVPETIHTDEYKIKGTAEPGSSIQVLVNDKTIGNKSSNREGKFSIALNTKAEGNYEVVLVFNKKGLKTRRMKVEFVKQSLEGASGVTRVPGIEASYADLLNTPEKFQGKTVKFSAHVESIQEQENGIVAKVAYVKRDGRLIRYAFLVSETPISQTNIGKKISGVAEYLGRSDTVTLNVELVHDTGIPILKLVQLYE